MFIDGFACFFVFSFLSFRCYLGWFTFSFRFSFRFPPPPPPPFQFWTWRWSTCRAWRKCRSATSHSTSRNRSATCCWRTSPNPTASYWPCRRPIRIWPTRTPSNSPKTSTPMVVLFFVWLPFMSHSLISPVSVLHVVSSYFSSFRFGDIWYWWVKYEVKIKGL